MMSVFSRVFWTVILMSASLLTHADTKAAAPADTVSNKSSQVLLSTDFGKVVIELYSEQAPVTTRNFLDYVNSRFYDGTIFHRVVPGFVVQGGGFTFDFIKKPTRDPIVNESGNGLKNTYGTLSMARLPAPDTATSQFYINLANNYYLNAEKNRPGYTVFGRVVEGMEIIEKIAQQPRGLYRAFPEAPNEPVRILKATLLGTEKSGKADKH